MEQQTFTTDVTTSNAQISSERQDRAAKLTQQIIANGKIAASSMIEMGRDLKTVRDERLFTELGFESFEEYCEKKCGIGKRHGYNFIQIYEKFGEEKLKQLPDPQHNAGKDQSVQAGALHIINHQQTDTNAGSHIQQRVDSEYCNTTGIT